MQGLDGKSKRKTFRKSALAFGSGNLDIAKRFLGSRSLPHSRIVALEIDLPTEGFHLPRVMGDCAGHHEAARLTANVMVHLDPKRHTLDGTD
jgi:hypothetical protein